MRVPLLLPLLRSTIQARLLAELYLHPEAEYSLTDLARTLGASVKTIHLEANRLTQGGFVAERRLGNLRMVRADTAHRLASPLTELLAATYGVEPVLTDLLSRVDGVDSAYLYGSWAARYQGHPGPIPADIDVLVIGDASRDRLDAIAETARANLRAEVTIHRESVHRWLTARDDPFLAHIRSQPLVRLAVGRGMDDAMESGPARDRTDARRTAPRQDPGEP